MVNAIVWLDFILLMGFVEHAQTHKFLIQLQECVYLNAVKLKF